MASMTSEPHGRLSVDRPDSVEMPRPTVWPMVLSLGLLLSGVGVATNLVLTVGGVILFVFGLAGWIAQLLPGRGHMHEELVEPARRPQAPVGAVGTVSQLGTGMPGYRLRLPIDMHPVSAGIWGGIAGGVAMAVPALIYGVVSGHGIWYPINLLAGMVLPLSQDKLAHLEQFDFGLFALAVVIHVVMCLVIGLIYGVLMPTLPEIPRPMAWGGLLMPLLWTAVSFSTMSIVNRVMAQGVNWPWFIASQFLFGVVAAAVVMSLKRLPLIPAGIVGGLVGGAVMALPALLWALANGHSIWYPVNLLAGMVMPMENVTAQDPVLDQYHANWFAAALAIHVAMSVAFGVLYGSLLPQLPAIPAPIAWGGMLLPLIWTGISYSLMGVVNPALADAVDWRWFIVSQFVFGNAAGFIVVNSEKVYIPPAGAGPSGGSPPAPPSGA
jgi:hypothetical protein